MMMNNPWSGMPLSSRRRVDYDIDLDIFWIKNEKNCYGLYIFSDVKMENIPEFELKGIEMHKTHRENKTEFIFLLKNRENWEIFLTLCRDLIAAASLKKTGREIIDEIFRRLNRWKQILSETGAKTFPLKLEMGLLGELICLKEKVFPRIGINEAIRCWTGPDFEKQDFIMEDMIIEVKTYSISKGKKIRISSAEQLFYSRDIPLYINAIALEKSSEGCSLETVIGWVLEESEISPYNQEIFELKLLNYGYYREIYSENISTFKVIENEIYHVEEDFPRIKQELIPAGTENISYDIDLWKCSKFLKNI